MSIVRHGFGISCEETEPNLPKNIENKDSELQRFYADVWHFHPFNLIFGGGPIHGFVYSLSGYQGTGKTTLCLQLLESCYKNSVEQEDEKKMLYISNEQMVTELSTMCDKLGVENVYLVHVKGLKKILTLIEEYDFIVIDSLPGVIYDLGDEKIKNEMIECAMEITSAAKKLKKTIIFITHLTKSGMSVGSSKIGHVVDGVLKLHRGNVEYFNNYVDNAEEEHWESCNIIEVQKMRMNASGCAVAQFDNGQYHNHGFIISFTKLLNFPKNAFAKVVV